MRVFSGVPVLASVFLGLLLAGPVAAQVRAEMRTEAQVRTEVREGGPLWIGEREAAKRILLVDGRPYVAVEGLAEFFEGEWDARPADERAIIILTGRERVEAVRGIIILTGRTVSERGIIILTGREAWIPLADLAKGMGTEVRTKGEGYLLEPARCDGCPIRPRAALRPSRR